MSHMPVLSVVTWKWKPANPEYRSKFGPETVNTMRRMVARHYRWRHRFICVTDDPAGLDPEVEVIPLWDDHSSLVHPKGNHNPSCYRRLKMFAPDASKIFGPRFVSLDLDCVITGDMQPLWDTEHDFIIYGDTNPTTPYNGSMIYMLAGARPQVWTQFDPVESVRKAESLGYFGSDQAWIGACLGPNERKFTERDGVYSFRNQLGPHRQDLPERCRIVICHGQHDPWGGVMQRLEWVRNHYR